MTDHRPALTFVVTVFALTLLTACSGSGSGSDIASPTMPSFTGSTKMLATDWGSLSVSTGDCSSVDFDRLVDSVAQGYDRARQVVGPAVDNIRLDGLTVTAHEDLVCSGTAAYGCYYFDRDQIRFRCGSENVMNHELQHRFCDRLNSPCDCYRIDHEGGFDLDCQPA